MLTQETHIWKIFLCSEFKRRGKQSWKILCFGKSEITLTLCQSTSGGGGILSQTFFPNIDIVLIVYFLTFLFQFPRNGLYRKLKVFLLLNFEQCQPAVTREQCWWGRFMGVWEFLVGVPYKPSSPPFGNSKQIFKQIFNKYLNKYKKYLTNITNITFGNSLLACRTSLQAHLLEIPNKYA